MPTDQHGFPQSPVTTASRDGNPVAAAGGVHSVDAVIIVVVVVVVVLLLFSQSSVSDRLLLTHRLNVQSLQVLCGYT